MHKFNEFQEVMWIMYVFWVWGLFLLCITGIESGTLINLYGILKQPCEV